MRPALDGGPRSGEGSSLLAKHGGDLATAGAAAVGLAALYVLPTLTALGAVAGLVVLALVTFLPVRALPCLAVLAFTTLPIAYGSLPHTFSRSLCPAILLMLAWVLRARTVERLPSLARFALFGVCLWLVVEIVLSPTRTRSEIWCLTFLVVVFASAKAVRLDVSELTAALRTTWAFGACFVFVIAYIEHGRGSSLFANWYARDGLVQHWSVYRITTTLGHPLVNSTFFATSAVLFFGLAISGRPRYTLPALLSVAGLLYTVSRSGVIALVAGVVLVVLLRALRRDVSVLQKAAAVFVAFLALVVVVSSPALKARSASEDGAGSSVYRSNLVGAALHIAKEDHYLGSGAATSIDRYATENKLPLENGPLQLLISLGWPGAALLSLSLLLLLGALLRQGDLIAVAGTVTFLISSGSFPAWEDYPGLLALLPIAILVGRTPSKPRDVDGS